MLFSVVTNLGVAFPPSYSRKRVSLSGCDGVGYSGELLLHFAVGGCYIAALFSPTTVTVTFLNVTHRFLKEMPSFLNKIASFLKNIPRYLNKTPNSLNKTPNFLNEMHHFLKKTPLNPK